MGGGVGKDQLLFVNLAADLGNVGGVVGDTLEVGNGMEEFGYFLALRSGELFAGDLHKVSAQLVLVAIDHGFHILHKLMRFVRIAVAQFHGGKQVLPRLFSHGVGDKAALLNGQGRVRQKALLQSVHFLLLGGFGPVGNHKADQAFHQTDKRHQHNHGAQSEQRVHKGN